MHHPPDAWGKRCTFFIDQYSIDQRNFDVFLFLGPNHWPAAGLMGDLVDGKAVAKPGIFAQGRFDAARVQRAYLRKGRRECAGLDIQRMADKTLVKNGPAFV